MPSYKEQRERFKKRSKIEARHNEQLRALENKHHEVRKQLLAEVTLLTQRANQLTRDLESQKATDRHMLLWCPSCGQRHIDEGEFATKEHHTHACQHCGMVWRPAIGPTIGVAFLPGFKNESRRLEGEVLVRRLAQLKSEIAVVGHDDRPKQIIDEIIAMVTP